MVDETSSDGSVHADGNTVMNNIATCFSVIVVANTVMHVSSWQILASNQLRV